MHVPVGQEKEDKDDINLHIWGPKAADVVTSFEIKRLLLVGPNRKLTKP